MKKTIRLILMVICLPAAAMAHEDKKVDANVVYTLLSTKGSLAVQSFSGFRVNVLMLNGEPAYNVFYVNAQISGGKITPDSQHVLMTKNDNQEQGTLEIQPKINALKGFQPSKVVLADEQGRDGGDEGDDHPRAYRFDFLDSNGIVRLSNWLDVKTGFSLQTASYDTNGRLLSLSFYSKLRVNDAPYPVGNLKDLNVSLSDFFKHHREFDGDDISNIKKLGKKIIEKELL